MKNGKIEKIQIVGGGSAGWMTAAYLARTLPNIKISLIESSDIPVIGVGEATIAHLWKFLHILGLQEKEWMPACNASYKYAIRFDNWHEKGDQYWHPFEDLPRWKSTFDLASYWWYKRSLTTPTSSRESLYSDCFLGVDLLKENRILRQPGAHDFADHFTIQHAGEAIPQRVSYAYHFDAGLFGEYLKNNIAKPAGVEHIVDDVTEVHQREDGAISSIDTKGGLTLDADLFIDCSGFRSLLIDGVYKEPFESYSKSLFCDRAIAMQVPYEDRDKELRPYTTATAITSGWVWNTPLIGRMGTGYVYCSAFEDPDKAETMYRQHLGEDRVKDLTARHIPIRVGKFRNSWVKNCVAIGLSSGFIEPLESTGIHFIHKSIEQLSIALSAGFYNNGLITGFNNYTTTMLEETRDFLALHYGLTNREDTDFWREVKYKTEIPASLGSTLSQSKFRFPAGKLGYTFGNNSWICILNGMNHLPEKDPYLTIPEHELAVQIGLMERMKDMKNTLRPQLQLNAAYLDKLHAGKL